MIAVDGCVSSLVGGNALGRSHLIVPFDGKCQYAERELIKLAADTGKIVIYIRLDTLAAVAKVYFYHGGREVQRCGSGNLAAAYYLFESLPAYTVEGCATLITRDGDIEVQKNHSRYGYTSTALPVMHCRAEPEFAQGLGLNTAPSALYEAGGDSDYLIGYYHCEQHVNELKPVFSEMVAATSRSVIVTAPSDDSAHDYVMRYFAPQWGNPEDLATGSAAAVATPLWHSKSGNYNFTVAQRSVTGALICSEFKKPLTTTLDGEPSDALISSGALVYVSGLCQLG